MNIEEKAIYLYQLGHSRRRIAFLLSLPYNDVKNITNNYFLKHIEFSNNEIPNIIEKYIEGISAKNLAIIYNIDRRRIFKFIELANIQKRSASDGRRVIKWNYNKLDYINSEETAYWLGFLYADAYNCELTNTVRISLSIKDIDHLEKLAYFFNIPTNQVYTFEIFNEETNKIYKCAGLNLYSKHLCRTLAKYGCPQAKSFIIKFPQWLEANLIQHFIRGYFDGDGCLTCKKTNNEWVWSVMSTKDMIDNIKNILGKKLSINLTNEYKSETNNNTWLLTCSGNVQVEKTCSYLYNNSNTFLQRKYEKYLDLLEFHRNKKRYFTEEEKNKMYNLREDGYTYEYIAKQFNCSHSGVSKSLRNEKIKSNK